MTREAEGGNALPRQVNDLQAHVTAADPAMQMDTNTVAALREALAYAQSIVDTVREPMLVVDGTLHIRTASRAFYWCVRSVSRGHRRAIHLRPRKRAMEYSGASHIAGRRD